MPSFVRTAARSVPGARWLHGRIQLWRGVRSFTTSTEVWEERYQAGGTSGAGSYGEVARFKADVLNAFVEEHDVATVLELGCGDGNQLELATYPHYLGFDVSETAVLMCRERFAADPTRTFELLADYSGQRADLTLSLDVIYHLIEDDVFDAHMHLLFDAADRHVAIFATNHDERVAGHVRHRVFTRWVESNAPQWQLARTVPNPHHGTDSIADFWFYERKDAVGA